MPKQYQKTLEEKIVNSSNVEESKVLLKEIRNYEWRTNIITRIFRSIRFTIVSLFKVFFIDLPKLILIDFILKLFEILVSSKNLTWAIAITTIITQLFKSAESTGISQEQIIKLITDIISKSSI